MLFKAFPVEQGGQLGRERVPDRVRRFQEAQAGKELMGFGNPARLALQGRDTPSSHTAAPKVPGNGSV